MDSTTSITRNGNLTMFGLLIRKEILDNLLNARFMAASILTVMIVVSSVIVLSARQRAEIRDYQNRVITQDEFISRYGHLNRTGWMARPLRGPSRYGPLVLGLDHEVQEENFASNPLPVLFSRLDLVAIVTIIMSLMAILFSYNALSGEREAGLLKLMLSTSLSRGTLVIGKFIGGSLSLAVPFTVGILVGLVTMSLQPDLSLHASDTPVFIALVCAAYIYTSAFYALGLLCSGTSQTSGVAVLKSLFAWVLLVLVIPNISPFLAARIYRIPSKAKVDQEVWSIQGEERDKIVGQRTQQMLASTYHDIGGTVKDLGAIAGNSESRIAERANTDPAFRERYNQFRKDWLDMVDKVNAEQAIRIKKVQEEFMVRSQYQEKLAGVFASLSPLTNFVFLATDLTESGIMAEKRWDDQVERYYGSLDPYLRGKYKKEIEKDPALTVNDYLDLSDRPRMRYQPTGMAERMALILPQLGALVLFNILFLGGALLSFRSYDVR